MAFPHLQRGFLNRLKDSINRWFGREGGAFENELDRVRAFEKKINTQIHHPELFIQALKHRSYLSVTNEARDSSYERLEFLGDLILNLITGERLFLEYPTQEEGDLTKAKSLLVNKKFLAQKAEELGIGTFILMSEGEERSGGRTRASLLSDVLESVIGAMYLDGGYVQAKAFVLKHILYDMNAILSDDANANFKGELLEWSQAQDWGIPSYLVVDEIGPEHSKKFTVEVLIKQQVFGAGKGLTKKDAEQQAAREALKKIKQN